MKYLFAILMALAIVAPVSAGNCYVAQNRQLVQEYYAAPVRERIVVQYAEVPIVKEQVRDYYGNEVVRVVDRSRNKDFVRVERVVDNHHHNNRVVEKVVVEKQVVRRENFVDRIRDNRNNKQVKEIRIEKVQVRGHH